MTRDEITHRTVRRDEIDRVDEIDRPEVIDHVYHLHDGQLVLEEEHRIVGGWGPGAFTRNKRPINLRLFRAGG